MNSELIAKAKEAGSAEELLTMAKENDQQRQPYDPDA